ncbi:MAG: hypothetical protein Q9166_000980 [cf. Caloplaca sp. 2 TL-2023]
MAKIRQLLTQIDSESVVNLRLEHVTKPDVITLQEEDGILMIRRRDILTPRKCTVNLGYWVKFLKTATLLHDMVARREELKMRFIQYREAGAHERLDMVKEKMIDIALTLGMHPTSLGVKQQDSGMIILPDGVSLDNTVVTDMFGYLDRARSGGPKVTPGTQSIRIHGEKPIPHRVLDVNVKRQSTARIDAVVVVEHRNVSWLDIKNVLFVMTSGFPSTATKEYLHLLSRNPKLENVPFLYFSDHDMSGFTIFQTLKYGSKNSAWASKSMICPQLEYAGPTIEDLKDSTRIHRPRWEAQYREDYPGASMADVKKQADRWQRNHGNKINAKFRKATLKDMQTLVSFQKLGWLEHEPEVHREVRLITGLLRGSKFRLADMTIVDLDYLRTFVENKLQKKCRNRAAVTVLPPVPRGVHLQNTPSQFSIVPLVGAETQASKADLEMIASDPDQKLPLSPRTISRLVRELDLP